MGLAPTTVWSYGSVDHPGSFNYPAFTIEAGWRRPVREVDQPARGRERGLSAASASRRPDAPLGEPSWRSGGDGHAWHGSDLVYRPGADHAPARRALVRGVTATPRPGTCLRPGTSRGVRAHWLLLSAIQGRRATAAWPGVDAGKRGLPVRQRPAGGDDVYHDHTLDDPLERLRGTGRLLPAARRTRGHRRRQAPACPGARRSRRVALHEIPIAIQDRPSTQTARSSTRTTGLSSRGSTPRSCRFRSSPRRPARAERHLADLQPGVLRQHDGRGTGRPGRSSRSSSAVTASAF